MTERGLPSVDGSPACPFVAFEDDRDARADRPDHRHRCFAEPEPAPRALAHQEAYCLSSAFPVCPTFQAWARREAAHARPGAAGGDASSSTEGGAGGSAADGGSAVGAAASSGGDGRGADGRGADEWAPGNRHDAEDELPIETRPRRNPPRDWAAPPPWATGGAAGTAGGSAAGGSAAAGGGQGGATSAGDAATRPGPTPGTDPAAPAFLAPRPAEGQGLAGSSADRLASGESIEDVMPGMGGAPVAGSPSSGGSATVTSPSSGARSSDLPSSGPDPELAGLVGGAAAAGAMGGAGGAASSGADGYPPASRTGKRPAVSSTRTPPRGRDRPPQLEHVQHDGPAWERARRYEAYPTIKSRSGFGGVGGLGGLPRVALLAGALAIAALALFFLPALLPIGGGGDQASPSPSASVAATTPPSPTPEPAPTPQIYTIKEGDTLSKIAKKFDLTLDQLLEANKDTIDDPDKISVGDEIIIPVPPPDEVTDEESSPTT